MNKKSKIKTMTIDEENKFPQRTDKDYNGKPPILLRVGYGETGLFAYDAISGRTVKFQHYESRIAIDEGDLQSVTLSFYSDESIIDREAEKYIQKALTG